MCMESNQTLAPVRIEGHRVLVVEDDPKLGSLIVRALATADVAADLAPSGEIALPLATERRYSAMVIDFMLPGMDGLELCRRLRRGGLRAPIVLMSARDGLSPHVRPAGADGHLTKPFALDELFAMLDELPEHSPARPDPARSRGIQPAGYASPDAPPKRRLLPFCRPRRWGTHLGPTDPGDVTMGGGA